MEADRRTTEGAVSEATAWTSTWKPGPRSAIASSLTATPGAPKTDAELLKDAAAGPIYDPWFRKLEDGSSDSEVADWPTAAGIRPGPYRKSGRWTVGLVRETTLLLGCRPP
jgi:hypothetical protein